MVWSRMFTGIAMLLMSALQAWSADDAPPAPPWLSPLSREAPLTGHIREPRSGRALMPDALINRLASVDFVILGERHDNADHHRLQAWITERLLERGRPYAVAFEMIDGAKSAKLAAYLADPSADAAGLGPALDWGKSGWPDWRHYQPIAAAALSHDLPILAANLPPDLVRAVAKDGLAALPADLAARLHLEPDKDAAVLAAHAAEIQAAHCGVLPEHSLAPFAVAQYARDAKMARVMADQRQQSDGKSGVVLIAGAGHARTDRGVPLHLARMAPDAKILSLAFVEADDESAEADVTALPFDVVWFTARVEDVDHCAALKRSVRPKDQRR